MNIYWGCRKQQPYFILSSELFILRRPAPAVHTNGCHFYFAWMQANMPACMILMQNTLKVLNTSYYYMKYWFYFCSIAVTRAYANAVLSLWLLCQCPVNACFVSAHAQRRLQKWLTIPLMFRHFISFSDSTDGMTCYLLYWQLAFTFWFLTCLKAVSKGTGTAFL